MARAGSPVVPTGLGLLSAARALDAFLTVAQHLRTAPLGLRNAIGN